MFVAVRHKESDTKVWWFTVPESLKELVKIGSTVMCDTSQGDASGVVCSILDGFTLEEAQKLVDAAITRGVFAVDADVKMEDVYIEFGMSTTYPAAQKLSKRVKEYVKYGRFQNKVLLRDDHMLVDGYTSYLVARMFGHDRLRCRCFVHREERKE